MELQNLPKIKQRGKRRLGQGHGSGRVKTSGRGTKGQKARNNVSAYFYSGGSLAFVKRLPFRRGKGKNKVFKKKPIAVNIKVLGIFSKGSVVDVKALVAKNIVAEKDARAYGVKVLGDGTLSVPLTVKLATSKNAAKKIEKAGGKVEA